MNFLTPSWQSFFTVLAITLPILGGVFAGAAYLIDKNLPIKYKRASEINSQLDNYINSSDDSALWKASEFFKTVPLDHLTDKQKKRISEILSNNLDNKNNRFGTLMDLAANIYSPENDALFGVLLENDKSDPGFVQHYPERYFLRRETDEVNPQLLSLINHPKYTQFKIIHFIKTSVHLSDNSDSAAVALANNKEVIDELIKVQDDWFEQYEKYKITNIKNGVHAFDIDQIIRGTYLAQRIEEKRNQAGAGVAAGRMLTQ